MTQESFESGMFTRPAARFMAIGLFSMVSPW
jgi:hypothetical protein